MNSALAIDSVVLERACQPQCSHYRTKGAPPAPSEKGSSEKACCPHLLPPRCVRTQEKVKEWGTAPPLRASDRELCHALDQRIAKLRALHFFRTFHQTGEVIRHNLL